MKLIIKKGRTSLLVRIFLQDSSSTTGAGLTGLTSSSTGLVCYRARDDDGNAGATQLTLSAGTRGTWSSGGFVEKDATNMPGVYELGLPDAGQATGSESVTYMVKGATNLAPLALEIQLVAFDPQVATNLGLSALPTANPGAANGLLISGSNSGTTTLGALTVTGASTMTGGLVVSAGATITGSTNGAGLTISGGGTSGAGLVINTTSGDGVQVSPTAGHGINIAANGTSKHGITSTGGTAGTSDGIKGVAGTGGVDIRGNITGNLTGNVSGSVGSLTTNNDKTGYSLSQSFPSNFSSLAITAGGAVTVGTNNDKTGYSLTQTFPTNFSSLAIDGSGDVTYNNAAPPTTASIATAVFTTALTESYSALHAVPTVAQALLEIRGHLCEKSVSGTTLTTKKIDGSTTAESFTLNDATNPTSITRAT